MTSKSQVESLYFRPGEAVIRCLNIPTGVVSGEGKQENETFMPAGPKWDSTNGSSRNNMKIVDSQPPGSEKALLVLCQKRPSEKSALSQLPNGNETNPPAPTVVS